MKINITVDLDWLNDEGDMDELVQHQIINGVKSAISKTCLDKVESQASKAIDAAIRDAVDRAKVSIEERAQKFASDWLGKPVEVTDKWGEVVKECTIESLVKESFDNTLNKRVDNKGAFCGTSSYSGNMPLIEYLTGKTVSDVVANELKGFKRDIDAKIKSEINKGIQNNVSDAFAEMVVGVAQARHKDSKAIKGK